MSITKQSSSREGAEVVGGWGCKCIVVTNSEGSIAYIDPKYLSPENNQQVAQLDTTTEVCTERGARLVEHRQKATSAVVRHFEYGMYTQILL